MRTVVASIPVKAPGDFTVAFLNSYIQEHLLTSSGPHLQLHLPLHELAGVGVIEVDVTVHVTYLPKHAGESPRLLIAWSPGDPHLFPSFDGTITAVSCEGTKCTLTITGAFDAPSEIAGYPYDAELGARIERPMLEKLLQEFRQVIEADYHDRIKWDSPVARR